ncbi:MAG TPA: CPBP family intramembrane metalloprotease [Thermoflexia bacterium]|nr:CPBP family intramembrane metalloprotease [Thermoflexia bacterium]
MNAGAGTSRRALAGPWYFFALAFGLSWLFWIPAALSGQGTDMSSARLLLYLGGLGPPLAGILLTHLTRDREGRWDYWRHVVDFKRIGAGWYGVILLTVPALTGLAALLDVLLGGSPPQLEADLSRPLALLSFALFTLLFGPLPEELGWRGYVLDRLQARWNGLASSLILGTAWSLWHLPLFFIQGTYQHGLGLGSSRFWLFMVGMVPVSVLYTWIYNNTDRSILSAVLFHFTTNFTGELLSLSSRAEFYNLLLIVIAATVVTVIWGPETLTRRRKGTGLDLPT